MCTIADTDRAMQGDSLHVVPVEAARDLVRPWFGALYRDYRALGQMHANTFDAFQRVSRAGDGSHCVDPLVHIYVDGTGGAMEGGNLHAPACGFAVFFEDIVKATLLRSIDIPLAVSSTNLRSNELFVL